LTALKFELIAFAGVSAFRAIAFCAETTERKKIRLLLVMRYSFKSIIRANRLKEESR
jgi:hypothetical protein